MGNLLLERRKALGYSLKDVEEATGMSQGNLSRWENGEIQYVRDDSMWKVAKVADLYDITTDAVIQSVENNYINKHHGHKENLKMDSKLRARRKELGYSATEVADTIGVSEITLSQWEVGYAQKPRNKAAVMALAELYGWGVVETFNAIEEAFRSRNKEKEEKEESIIDIAQEAYDNMIKEENDMSLQDIPDHQLVPDEIDPYEETMKAINKAYAARWDEDNAEPVKDNTITCGKAIDVALDAVFAWGRNRHVYDDMRDTINACAPTDANHRTIKEHQIETYILSLIYGNVSFDTFCTVKDSLKSCLNMMKSFEED